MDPQFCFSNPCTPYRGGSAQIHSPSPAWVFVGPCGAPEQDRDCDFVLHKSSFCWSGSALRTCLSCSFSQTGPVTQGLTAPCLDTWVLWFQSVRTNADWLRRQYPKGLWFNQTLQHIPIFSHVEYLVFNGTHIWTEAQAACETTWAEGEAVLINSFSAGNDSFRSLLL